MLPTIISAHATPKLSHIQWEAAPTTVALTFGDGPNPTYTPQILVILKKYNVKATLFVMGSLANKHPELTQRIAREGHAVANHSMPHPKLTRLSPKRLYTEIVSSKEAIAKALGKDPVCLRPPFGNSNARVKQFIEKQGMVLVPIGFNSFDHKRPGVEKLTRWVVNNARSRQVFLLHDGDARREQTVAALHGIIEGIRTKGFGFTAICMP